MMKGTRAGEAVAKAAVIAPAVAGVLHVAGHHLVVVMAGHHQAVGVRVESRPVVVAHAESPHVVAARAENHLVVVAHPPPGADHLVEVRAAGPTSLVRVR